MGEKDKIRKYLGAVLMATMIPLLFISTAQASPDEYLIWYHEQYNDDGTSLMIIRLYRMTEAEPDYDFYIIKIRVQGMKSQGEYYMRADIWSNGVCNDWEPKSGTYSTTILSISVGSVSFPISIPTESIGTTGGLMPTFGWQARTILVLAPDKEFVSSWYVADGVDFAFLVQASEWYDPPTEGPYCTDSIQVYYPYTFGFKTLAVQAGPDGTTSPKPGTYNYYPAGFTASVWTRPYSSYMFDYWVLEGATLFYGNPITVPMNSDHTLKVYFAYVLGGGGGGGHYWKIP